MLRYFCSEMWKFQLCGKRTFLFLHMDLISFSWRFIHVRNSSVPRQGLYTNRRSLKKRYLFSLFTSHRTFLCFIFSDQRNSVWKKKEIHKNIIRRLPKNSPNVRSKKSVSHSNFWMCHHHQQKKEYCSKENVTCINESTMI